MHDVKEIITDEQLNDAWGNANFGNVDKREVLRNTLLKCAAGYKTGRTAECIVKELSLVKLTKWELTVIGKEYLFAAYSGGLSL
jgi:hypothetical protein